MHRRDEVGIIDTGDSQRLRASQLAAAATTATRAGLGDVHPRLLANGSEAVVALDPLPVVARVCAIDQDAMRRAPAQRQVDVASFGATHDAPLVHLLAGVDPGPYEIDGQVVTLWDRVVDARPVSPYDVGRSLRDLHAGLATYVGPLASYDPRPYAFDVAAALLDEERDVAEVLRSAAAMYEPPVLPIQPVHGDAHIGNVMRTPDGPRWIDLEDLCAGPVEWDLACLAHRAAVYGQGVDETRAVLEGYGADAAERAELMTTGVALYAAARTARAYVDRPALRDQLDVRLAWLRDHLLR